MNLELKKIEPQEIEFFQQKMVESFQSGVSERFGDLSAAPIPPEDDLSRCSQNENCDLWAIVLDGVPAGATVIEKKDETGKYSLDLLFIFKEYINRKIGVKAWQLIEATYPNAKIWETHTPYFERRNIHFYVNKCGFKIVEFFNESNREEHDLTKEFKDINTSGFFRFEKVMRKVFWLLISTMCMTVGCNYMKPLTDHPINTPAMGVAPVEEMPAADIPSAPEQNGVFDPNNYSGSDIERINAALKDAGSCGGTVRLGKRKPPVQMNGNFGINTLEERDIWMIDSAMLIPGGVHLIIDNTTVKLSNICRDNMIRSANCGENCNTVQPLKNIRITGVGNAVLEGADIPRATGDGVKPLTRPGVVPPGPVSFGSDAGKVGTYQKGDWRNIGILLVKVSDFAIENLTIRDSHCWAISLEACTRGKVRDIVFDSHNGKKINGKWQLFRNQDGLDLRRGCRDILIENISGVTGDDLIALTAIPANPRPAGSGNSTMILGGDENVSDGDVCNIIIRNVRGYCAGGHHIVRFLNTKGVKMYNIILDGVIDTSPAGHFNIATIKIGDNNPNWGGPTPLGDTYGFHISNIHSRSKYAVLIAGSLQDSTISNVVNFNMDNRDIVACTSGEENMRNVRINNVLNAVEKNNR